MGRRRRTGRWVAATALLALTSVALAESRDPSSAGMGRRTPKQPEQALELPTETRLSPAWLDLHGGRSRAINREPDLLRHEF